MDVISRHEAEIFLDIDSGTGDALLERLITDVSAMLARITGRTDWGASAERTEYADGGDNFVATDYWPISSAAIYEDQDHDFDDDSLVDSDDIHIGTDGIIWYEGYKFEDGPEAVKIVYTGGYANTAAIPEIIKAAALRQLEHEYNRRQRRGAQSQTAAGEVLPDVRSMLSQYTRNIGFAG